MYGFESFSSKTVNEAVNSFWSSQWSEGQVAKNASSEKHLDRVRKHFQSKLENLEKACSRYHISPNEVQVKLQTFSLEPKSRLVLCRTAKHGSTSWANNFVKMYLRDRRTVKTQVYLRRLERKAYSRESKEAVIKALREKQHNYTSFFVCRNPVEKFLSVYNYLMDARARRSPLVMNVKGRVDFQKRLPPTWAAFIHKLARSNKTSYLGLLQPLYDQCKPCSLNYKAIVHMETFDQDSGFLLRQSNFGWLAPAHFNSHGNNSLGKEQLAKLFRKTSAEDIRLIIRRYEKDFDICGYHETLNDLRTLLKIKTQAKKSR